MFADSEMGEAKVNITYTPRIGSVWQNANLIGFAGGRALDWAEIVARFWRFVQIPQNGDGCWLWTGNAVGKAQHGQFALAHNVNRYAHRLSWLLHYGSIPRNLKVCHRCDVPRCVNPRHLFVGTQADNLADCRAKGRMPSVRQGAKLSIVARAAICQQLSDGARQVDLAATYGVSRSRIYVLAKGARVSHARTVARSVSRRKSNLIAVQRSCR